MGGAQTAPADKLLHHQAIDERAHARKQRLWIAWGHRAIPYSHANTLDDVGPLKLENEGSGLQNRRKSRARRGRNGLGEKHEAALVAVMKAMDRAHVRVEAIDRMRVVCNLFQNVLRLLREEVHEGEFEDVTLRRKVIKERRPFEAEGLGQPRHCEVGAFALKHFYRRAREVSALVVVRRSCHRQARKSLSPSRQSVRLVEGREGTRRAWLPAARILVAPWENTGKWWNDMAA